MTLDPVAKILVIAGIALIFLGGAWQLGWIQALRLGQLPGDIAIKKENMGFYFPLTTCLLISAIFSFIAWLFRK